MTSVTPRLGVLAAICCWLGTAQAAGISPAMGIYAGNDSLRSAVPNATRAVASPQPRLGRTLARPRAIAFGLGPLGSMARAWNAGLAANARALPGLHSVATARLRQRFVDSADAYLFFNVEQACLAVGCMTEFAFTGATTATEANAKVMQAANTVVPVPPAALLFSSALGLLAWIRRRSG